MVVYLIFAESGLNIINHNRNIAINGFVQNDLIDEVGLAQSTVFRQLKMLGQLCYD